jgi:aspartate 1-decarboxylase
MAEQISQHALTLIAAYNKAHRVSTYVIQTPADSTIGGVSAEFVGFTDKSTVILKYANGDTFKAPFSEISIRLSF